MIPKIIIVPDCDQSDGIVHLVAMETLGYEVKSVLYCVPNGSLSSNPYESAGIIQDLKNQLYDDMYNKAKLIFKVKEVSSIEDEVQLVSKYISIVFDANSKSDSEDTLLYYAGLDEELADMLQEQITLRNGRIYLQPFTSLIGEYDDVSLRNIFRTYGLNDKNLIPEYPLSLLYFLSVLTERIISG